MTTSTSKLPIADGLNEVLLVYPDFPRLIAIKIDAKRRGVHYTDRALATVDPARHLLRTPYIFGSRDGQLAQVPESLLLRDGSSIITDPTPLDRNPYIVDVIDGQTVLVDNDTVVEQVEFWPRPAYYDQVTSRGTPMKYILYSRPQRLNVYQFGYCHFWAKDQGCRFCDIVPNISKQKADLGTPTTFHAQDLIESLREALKETGRYTTMCLTGGSDFHGAEPFDREVDRYIEVLQAIGTVFRTRRFPSQLVATALTESQLRRLYEQTGLLSYSANLEVMGEQAFNEVCPGKAAWVGYDEWKCRLIRAVDIFGRGRVDTGLVAGAELVTAYGSEDEALKITLDEAESLAAHGVTTVFIVWVPRPLSRYAAARTPSLEYYIRLAQGLHDLRVKYGLGVEFDDYRRCGNHPDSDLARLL